MEPSLNPLHDRGGQPSPKGLGSTLHSLVTPGEDTRALPWLLRLLRTMAVQDWLVTGYFTVLLIAVASGSGPLRMHCVAMILRSLAVVIAGIVLTRGAILPFGSKLTALAYRVMVSGAVIHSYFLLRDVLPTATARSVDAELYAFDLRVFGFEPSVAWDAFVNPHTTEWFSFFYFGYFVLISIYIEGSMFFARDIHRFAAFSLGVLTVFCVGHCTYMLVPGFGPYRHLHDTFAHPLAGPTFWPLVWNTVSSAGAQKDIFPSLHTAVPSFLTFFAWRNRRVAPFRYIWLPTGLFTSQIIIATMFLRWHYLIDIVAGLSLASFSAFVLPKVAEWERRRREAMGVMPVWNTLFTLKLLRDPDDGAS